MVSLQSYAVRATLGMMGTSRPGYKEAYYLANRDKIRARSKARRLRVAADPVLAAKERAQKLDWERRKAALRPPRAPRALKPLVNRYADPEYREACISRAHATYTRKRDDNVWRMLSGAQQRARRDGRVCTLTRDDIKIPKQCPICEVVLVSAPGRSIAASPTLDRVKNEQGYERGNVAVICMQCNRVKADASAELHERIAAYMRKGGK